MARWNKRRRRQKDLEVAERRAQIAQLYRGGITQRSIASHLGVSLGTVNNDIAAIIEEANIRSRESVEAVRYLVFEGMLSVYRAHLPLAVAGDHRSASVVQAMGKEALEMIEEKKPTKIELSGDQEHPLLLSPAAPQWDLSKLTDDQLLEYESIKAIAENSTVE